ncbi:hypothetical protein [Allokutzneria oryzae]|uniref:Secreted protein n=1 Tax=Allokutzneria oryzae TaxID=1378989 RepID=A0ABV5ZPD2_9PSEU
MFLRRCAVTAAATLGALLLASPGAFAGAGVKTSGTAGGQVTCIAEGVTVIDASCSVRDTKHDGHSVAMEWRWVNRKGEVVNSGGLVENHDGVGSEVCENFRWFSDDGVTLQFRAVVLKTTNGFGKWKTF